MLDNQVRVIDERLDLLIAQQIESDTVTFASETMAGTTEALRYRADEQRLDLVFRCTGTGHKLLGSARYRANVLGRKIKVGVLPGCAPGGVQLQGGARDRRLARGGLYEIGSGGRINRSKAGRASRGRGRYSQRATFQSCSSCCSVRCTRRQASLLFGGRRARLGGGLLCSFLLSFTSHGAALDQASHGVTSTSTTSRLMLVAPAAFFSAFTTSRAWARMDGGTTRSLGLMPSTLPLSPFMPCIAA